MAGRWFSIWKDRQHRQQIDEHHKKQLTIWISNEERSALIDDQSFIIDYWSTIFDYWWGINDPSILYFVRIDFLTFFIVFFRVIFLLCICLLHPLFTCLRGSHFTAAPTTAPAFWHPHFHLQEISIWKKVQK